MNWLWFLCQGNLYKKQNRRRLFFLPKSKRVLWLVRIILDLQIQSIDMVIAKNNCHECLVVRCFANCGFLLPFFFVNIIFLQKLILNKRTPLIKNTILFITMQVITVTFYMHVFQSSNIRVEKPFYQNEIYPEKSLGEVGEWE